MNLGCLLITIGIILTREEKTHVSLKMSLKGFFFLFITLNSSEYVLCISGKPSRSCVRCNWNAFPFRFMPEHYRYRPPKDAFCNMTYECFSAIAPKNETCKKRNKINVTFPVISRYSNATSGSRLPKPVLAIKQEFHSTTSQTLSAFGKIWRLLVFCPMAAILSGIMIWFLVSITKPHRCQRIWISFTNLVANDCYCKCLPKPF